MSGRISKVDVRGNEAVRIGDVLYEIDPVDFEISVASAEAIASPDAADMINKQSEAERRGLLTTLSTSREEKQTTVATFEIARETYASAVTQVTQSRVNLQRTRVLSPVNGFVTNLQLRAGDYATKRTHNISMVDTDSFWVTAFFEETKLAGIHPGDPAAIVLMGFRDTVRGHVDSIARGINTTNTHGDGMRPHPSYSLPATTRTACRRHGRRGPGPVRCHEREQGDFHLAQACLHLSSTGWLTRHGKRS